MFIGLFQVPYGNSYTSPLPGTKVPNTRNHMEGIELTGADKCPTYPNSDKYKVEWQRPHTAPLRAPFIYENLLDKQKDNYRCSAYAILNLAIKQNILTREEAEPLVEKLYQKLKKIECGEENEECSDRNIGHPSLEKIPGIAVKVISTEDLFATYLDKNKEVLILDSELYAGHYMAMHDYDPYGKKLFLIDPMSGQLITFPQETVEAHILSEPYAGYVRNICEGGLRHVYFSVEFTDFNSFQNWVNN